MEKGIIKLTSGEQVECNIEISDGQINIHFPEDVDSSRWMLSANVNNDLKASLVYMQAFNDKLKELIRKLEEGPKICLAIEPSAIDLYDKVMCNIENIVGKGGVHKVITYCYTPASVNEIKADMLNANVNCNILCLLRSEQSKCVLDCCLL